MPAFWSRLLPQVRQYTLQSLASDINLMTPAEEVFSRRGGVKLLLMEIEHLRGALDKFTQPDLRAGPEEQKQPAASLPRNTRDAGVQTSPGAQSKRPRASRPSPVRGAIPAAVQVVTTAAPSSMECCSGGQQGAPSAGPALHDRATGPTRHVSASSMAREARAGPTETVTDVEAARRVGSSYLRRTSSNPMPATNGSGLRTILGQTGLKRGFQQSQWTGADKGVLTRLLSSPRNARPELGLDGVAPAAAPTVPPPQAVPPPPPPPPPPAVAAWRRGGGQRTGMVGRQHFTDHQDIVAVHRVTRQMYSKMPVSEKLPPGPAVGQLSMANGRFEDIIGIYSSVCDVRVASGCCLGHALDCCLCLQPLA
jgi:hypothetical protein